MSKSGWGVGPQELTSGIDTLVLSYRGVADSCLLTELEEAKETARALSTSVPFTLGGEECLLSAGSMGRHAFRLAHPRGLIGIGTGERLPVLRFQPYGEVLHSLGPLGVDAWIRSVMGNRVQIIEDIVSRVDLHADFAELNVTERDEENFVTRAGRVSGHHDRGVFTGYSFGKRSSRSISARIYDKTQEVADKGGTYVYELWGEKYVHGDVVWRVEFELHRGFLRKYGITTLDELIWQAGGLWKYATTDWLSLRRPTEDQTRSRWPVDPRWQAVEETSLAARLVPLEKVAALQSRDSAKREIAYVLGELVRWGAILGTPTLEQTLETLPSYIGRHLGKSSADFGELQRVKRIKMGLVS